MKERGQAGFFRSLHVQRMKERGQAPFLQRWCYTHVRMTDLGRGTIFAGHRIDGVAGRGGMGVVYRATQLDLDRTVALKVIASPLLEDGAARERFVREARAAAGIDHPNVLPVHYAGEAEGTAYIAMRYVDGDDLRSLVRRSGPLPPARAGSLTRQVAAALDAIHARGIVHRDVKPANILLAHGDHVYVSDFGLAKHTLSVGGTTKPGQWVGTLDYVAPEQIRGEKIDGRCDVYALGCVLYWVLTAQVPFPREGDEARIWAAPVRAAAAAQRDHSGTAAGARRHRRARDGQAARRALPDGGRDGARRRPRRRRRRYARVRLKRAADKRARRRDGRRRVGALARRDRPRSAARRRGVDDQLTATGGARRRGPPAAAAPRTAARRHGARRRGRHRGRGGPPQHGRRRRRRRRPRRRPPRRPPPPPPPRPRGPARPRVTATIDGIGTRPNGVTVAAGHAWVTSFRGTRVARVDTETNRPARSLTIGEGAAGIGVAGNNVWVALAAGRKQLLRIDARRLRITGRYPLAGDPTGLLVNSRAIWVSSLTPIAGGADQLERFDPRTGAKRGQVAIPAGIQGMTADSTGVWITNRRTSTLAHIAAATGKTSTPISLPYRPGRLAAGGDYLWMSYRRERSLSRIDPRRRRIVAIPGPSLGREPPKLVYGSGYVWFANYGEHTLSRIDPRRARIEGDPVPVGLNPNAIAIAGRTAWVTGQGDDSLTRVDF